MEKFLSLVKSCERIQTGLQTCFVAAVGSDRRLTKRGAEGNLKWGYGIVWQSRNCGCSSGLFCLVIGYSRWRGFLSLGIGFVYFMDEGIMG